MSEISKALRFELEDALVSLKKYDTWIFLTSLFALIMLLYKEFILTVVLLIIILILDAGRNHATGRVQAHFRKKDKERAEHGY